MTKSRYSFTESPRASVWSAFRDVQSEAWQISEDHGFHGQPTEFGTRLMLIVSEVAEALEDFRAGHAADDLWLEEKSGKPCGVPSELADIVIRVMDLAEVYEVDLAEAIRVKMAFNRGREFMHGKKF